MKKSVEIYKEAYDCYAYGQRRMHMVPEAKARAFVTNSYDPKAEAWLRIVTSNMIKGEFVHLFTTAKSGKVDFCGDPCGSSPNSEPAFKK